MILTFKNVSALLLLWQVISESPSSPLQTLPTDGMKTLIENKVSLRRKKKQSFVLNLPSFLCVCFNVASKNVEQHSKDDSLVAQRPKQLKSLQWGSADWLSPLNMLVYQIFSLSIPPQHPSLLTPPPPSVLPTAGCRAIDKKLIYHPIKCCYWNTALKKAKKNNCVFTLR